MADNMLSKRILKEIKIGSTSKLFYFLYDPEGTWGPKNCCYVKWKVVDGPYKDQIHILRFDFLNLGLDRSFPKNAPSVIMMTPMIHPHIHVNICLDILGTHKSKNDWSSIYNIEAIFNSIVALMSNIEHMNLTTVQSHYMLNIKKTEYKKIREMIETPFINETTLEKDEKK
jgi:ubiquitin-protein ligase